MTTIEKTSYKCSRCGYHIITIDQVFTKCPWCASSGSFEKSLSYMPENVKEMLQKRQELQDFLRICMKDLRDK